MSYAIYPVTQTRVELDNVRGKVDFTVTMSEPQIRQLMLMIGNPCVNKIFKVRWIRDMLNIGLREALCFVEEALVAHEYDYERMKAEWEHDPEVDDFRNNHGQGED